MKSDDSLTRFILETANVRGALVKLHTTWQSIVSRAVYPPAVADYLAQCVVASALFASSIKINGRLSIQMRGTGCLRTLFAECTTQGTLRGIAHYQIPVPDQITMQNFGADAILAISIENQVAFAKEPQRYQGLVNLQANSLAEAFENYFEQSEQLPTRLILFNNDTQAVGLLLQQLPEQNEHSDDWQRSKILLETATAEELFTLTPNELLYRLFHEEGVRILESNDLCFACSCSRQRVENALISLGQEEIEQTIAENGELTVHCDFCGQAYHFSTEQSLSLFWPKTISPSTYRLH